MLVAVVVGHRADCCKRRFNMSGLRRVVSLLAVLASSGWSGEPRPAQVTARERLLYVAVPGTPQRVPAGILVYDAEHEHKLIRRIPMPDVDTVEKPVGFKGICASAKTKRLY